MADEQGDESPIHEAPSVVPEPDPDVQPRRGEPGATGESL
jgi:hypothetical protein